MSKQEQKLNEQDMAKIEEGHGNVVQLYNWNKLQEMMFLDACLPEWNKE